jgi:hypothetical protein
MCECLERFKKQFRDKYPTWKGREVKGVALSEGIDTSTGRTIYYVPVYVDVGLKFPKETSLICTHCPCCGEAFASEEE